MLSMLLFVAHAQAGWADFAPAFPRMPCADGWTGCLVGARAVDPDLVEDAAGMPNPADARVSWFTFEPMPVFSPFAPVSSYVETARAPIPEPPVVDPLPEAILEPVPKRLPKRVPVDPVPEIVDPPVVPEVVEPVARPDVCSDLRALEPAAMLGKLSPEQLRCLDEAYAAAAKITERDALNRVRMANAFARGNKDEWERLVLVHFEQIDRSDPDLSYKYALFLRNKGRSEEAIRYAELSLERSTVWTSGTYTERVTKLHEIRAMSAQKLWEAAEEKKAAAPSRATLDAAESARIRTRVLAREWVDRATAAGKDATRALQVCTSAAGTSEYCAPR